MDAINTTQLTSRDNYPLYIINEQGDYEITEKREYSKELDLISNNKIFINDKKCKNRVILIKLFSLSLKEMIISLEKEKIKLILSFFSPLKNFFFLKKFSFTFPFKIDKKGVIASYLGDNVNITLTPKYPLTKRYEINNQELSTQYVF